MKLLQSLFLLALTLSCASATYASSQDGNEFRWQGVVADGKTLEIKGVNGEVRAEAASGNQVEVSATKRWNRSDPQSVNVKLVEHVNGVTICAVYPGRNGEPGRCEPGGGGQSAHNNDVKVEFIVRVPAGVRFIGRISDAEMMDHLARCRAVVFTPFNEDYGFPNSYKLAVQPGRLMSRDEDTLMAVVGALEAIKTGSTTVVENVAPATGVFAASATSCHVGFCPMVTPALSRTSLLYMRIEDSP